MKIKNRRTNIFWISKYLQLIVFLVSFYLSFFRSFSDVEQTETLGSRASSHDGGREEDEERLTFLGHGGEAQTLRFFSSPTASLAYSSLQLISPWLRRQVQRDGAAPLRGEGWGGGQWEGGEAAQGAGMGGMGAQSPEPRLSKREVRQDERAGVRVSPSPPGFFSEGLSAPVGPRAALSPNSNCVGWTQAQMFKCAWIPSQHSQPLEMGPSFRKYNYLSKKSPKNSIKQILQEHFYNRVTNWGRS